MNGSIKGEGNQKKVPLPQHAHSQAPCSINSRPLQQPYTTPVNPYMQNVVPKNNVLPNRLPPRPIVNNQPINNNPRTYDNSQNAENTDNNKDPEPQNIQGNDENDEESGSSENSGCLKAFMILLGIILLIIGISMAFSSGKSLGGGSSGGCVLPVNIEFEIKPIK